MSPLCSRNARPRRGLVGRAQWGTHRGHPEDTVNERAWKNDLWSLAGPCLGKARPGRARVGRVRGQAFLNSLRCLQKESVSIRALRVCHAQVVLSKPG
jgi:hypothetical protein